MGLRIVKKIPVTENSGDTRNYGGANFMLCPPRLLTTVYDMDC